MSKHNQTVGVEINKGIASMAGLVCFIGTAFFATDMGSQSPFVAGSAVASIAYGLAYCSARLGALAIVVGVVLFTLAYN